MPKASGLQAILSVAERLRAELGPASTEGASEAEVERLSRTLAEIADAAAGQTHEIPDEKAEERTAAALAGIEMVTRGELMRGNEPALREQLPGFVYIAVLPGAGMDRALELADRTKTLLEDTHE